MMHALPSIIAATRQRGAASSLLTGLGAYYKLDEASGTRVDAPGRGNDLTPFGSPLPGNAAGKVGNALALVPANSQYLSRASTPDLTVGATDWTLACWVLLTATTGDPRAISKDAGGVINREYLVQYQSGPARLTAVAWFAGTQMNVTANTFGALSLNTWYWVTVEFVTATKQFSIRINNGAADTVTTGSSTLDVKAAAFQIGAFNSGSQFWPGRVDEVGIWKRALTPVERAALYNGGAGLTYPFS